MIYPIFQKCNKSRFLIDFKDCTLRFSKSKLCFLNLKYSSILHFIKYTLQTAVHRFITGASSIEEDWTAIAEGLDVRGVEQSCEYNNQYIRELNGET